MSESCQKALQLVAAARRRPRKRRRLEWAGSGSEELVWNPLEDSQNSASVSLGTGLVLPQGRESNGGEVNLNAAFKGRELFKCRNVDSCVFSVCRCTWVCVGAAAEVDTRCLTGSLPTLLF